MNAILLIIFNYIASLLIIAFILDCTVGFVIATMITGIVLSFANLKIGDYIIEKNYNVDPNRFLYNNKIVLLSLIAFRLISKIMGIVSAIIVYICRLILAFAWILASGKWFTGSGLSEFLSAFIISDYVVKVFQLFDSIGNNLANTIAEKFINQFINIQEDYLKNNNNSLT